MIPIRFNTFALSQIRRAHSLCFVTDIVDFLLERETKYTHCFFLLLRRRLLLLVNVVHMLYVDYDDDDDDAVVEMLYNFRMH